MAVSIQSKKTNTETLKCPCLRPEQATPSRHASVDQCHWRAFMRSDFAINPTSCSVHTVSNAADIPGTNPKPGLKTLGEVGCIIKTQLLSNGSDDTGAITAGSG